MIIAIWIVVLLAVALWSALGWAMYRLLVMDHQWLGDIGPLLDRVPWGEAIEAWVPGWRELVQWAAELVQWGLSALGSAAPIVVWSVWGLGTLLLVGGGALLSLIVVLLRGKPAAPRAA